MFYLNGDYQIMHNEWMHSVADIYEFLSGCDAFHLTKIQEAINALPLNDESCNKDVSYAAIRALSSDSINKTLIMVIEMDKTLRESNLIKLAEDIRKKIPGAGTNLQLH